MLGLIGADSLDQLVEETVPAGIRLGRALELGEGFTDDRGENEVLEDLRSVAQKALASARARCDAPVELWRSVVVTR